MVEHPAPGRIGQSDSQSQHGHDDADRHVADGAWTMDVLHRGSADAGAVHHPRTRAQRRLGQTARSTSMNWGTLSAFLAMGGYGASVWGSYAVTAACIVL